MKKSVNKIDDKKKINYWKQIGLGLLIGLAFSFFFMWYDNTDEYSNCVDECVVDNNYCVSNLRVSDEDFFKLSCKDCSMELESCVEDCSG